MKKVISLLLAVAMLATLGLSAFAATDVQKITAPGSGTAVVKVDESSLSTAEWYAVQIPADKEITWGTTEVDMSYKVASQLAEGTAFTVTVSCDANKMTTSAGDDTIAFTPSGFEAQRYTEVNGGGTAAEPSYAEATTPVKLAIDSAAWNGIAVAVYEVTLTYTVAAA